MSLRNFAFRILACLFFLPFGCSRDVTPAQLPSLSTTDVIQITDVSATSGGNITADGGTPVISRGVCCDTNALPTIEDYKTSDGIGTGSFVSTIQSLNAGTTYFVRAYATNANGTNYGPEKSFKTLSAKDARLLKLNKEWKCTSAVLDGTLQPGYGNFKITFTVTLGETIFGFVATGRPAGVKTTPWPASGTLSYGTDFLTQLTRDDGLAITYTVSNTQLQLTFNYQGQGFDARTETVQGNWVYTFSL